MAAMRRCSHGCGREATIQRLRRQGGRHRAHGRAAEHSTWRRRRGCRLLSNRRGDEGPPQAPRSEGESSSRAIRSRSSRKGEIHWAELDGDGNDWRRGRGIPMVRRKHTARWSSCAIGRRRSSPELAGIGRGGRR
jgi:hypothetical protein